MDIETLMGKSGAYVVSERHRQVHGLPEGPRFTNPAVAISHETGSGALAIATGLARSLQTIEPAGGATWEVFDQQIIEKALQQEQWPKKLAESITEEKRFFIDELVDDLFSIRPPSWVLMPRVIETALNLATAGHAILVGHGATVVTAELPNVFHVRLTGSLDRRIDRSQHERGGTRESAAKFVRVEDHKREKYVRKHFHARLNNELLHDLAINTDRIAETDAIPIIFEAARRFFSTL